MINGLQLDFESADAITICNLTESYKYMKKENKEIAKLNPIPDHKSSDMAYNIHMMKHIKAVLEYYGKIV